MNSEQDVIFHVSVRPNDKVIVRNHYQNGAWATEERSGPCPVRKNETFEIILHAEHQHYIIAVNGHHLGVFHHRLPLHLVRYVNVSGEVTLDHILLEQVAATPELQLSTGPSPELDHYIGSAYPMAHHLNVQPPVYPPTIYFADQNNLNASPKDRRKKKFFCFN